MFTIKHLQMNEILIEDKKMKLKPPYIHPDDSNLYTREFLKYNTSLI